MISFKSLSFQNYHELVNLAQTSFLAKIIKKKKQYLLMHAANNILLMTVMNIVNKNY
jgi:hypothetical protein